MSERDIRRRRKYMSRSVYWSSPLLYLSEPETPAMSSGVFLCVAGSSNESVLSRITRKPAYTAPWPDTGSLIVLNGLTISPMPDNYLNLFASYIPNISQDMSDNNPEAAAALTFTVTMIIAAVCCIALWITQFVQRSSKRRKGYDVQPTTMFIAKLVLFTAVIMVVAALLGQDKGLPVILIIVAVIVAIYAYYTQNTVQGRYLYALGGNAKAAQLSGVNTDKVMFFAYTNMGFLSAVAALVCVARFNSAAPTAGTNYEMDAIGSCFIGGASAYGGTGTVSGAVIGAIFMGVLNNGMSILGIDSNWQKAVKGLVLLLAVLFDVVSKKRKSTK